MKKYILFALLLIGNSTSSFSQRGGFRGQERRPMREKVDAMKIGYLTNFLDLTTDEAKSFWPVYNKYQDELEQLRKSRRNNLINGKLSLDSMSDSDLEKMVDGELAFHQNEIDVQKKYHPQFKKVLPMKKVAKLYRAEEEFKKQLLQMIRDKRKDERSEMKQ